MSVNPFHGFIAQQTAEARARGISVPVIAIMAESAGPVRAIEADLPSSLAKLSPMPGRTEFGLLGCWSVPRAVRLLRKHAGLGGRAVAKLILRAHFSPDCWALWLRHEDLSVAACIGGQVLSEGWATYFGVRFSLPRQYAYGREGAYVARIKIRGGPRAVVCAATREDLAMVVGLANIVAERCLPSGHAEMVDLPIGQDELALVLKDSYLNKPPLVAEAIMGLRKLGGGRDRWLLTVLTKRPELRGLARAVRRKLTR